MKILVKTSRKRLERYYDLKQLPPEWEFVWAEEEQETNKLIEIAGDADAIFADAIEIISADLISQMPNLKIIHSEGVGFDKIDLEAATRRKIFVCNNKGVNAVAVAEQTIMLILAILKRVIQGDMLVRSGKQIETKSLWMMQGLYELSEMKIGLIGMGDIGRETAKRLYAFDADIYYNNRTRLSHDDEKLLRLTYCSLDELLRTCDIISLHIASNEQTKEFMNRTKFSIMKPNSILINTARGELINQSDLIWAMTEGIIGGAGLDCITPEPVLPDNEMLQLPEHLSNKIIFSPHIGGATSASFRRVHKTVWENFIAVSEGRRPKNIVNNL